MPQSVVEFRHKLSSGRPLVTPDDERYAMTSMGTKKINRMMILDYADGWPVRTFRAEIDIPLGDRYDELKVLMDDETNNVDKIVKLLLTELDKDSDLKSTEQKAAEKVARRFLAAAFDRSPPP